MKKDIVKSLNEIKPATTNLYDEIGKDATKLRYFFEKI